MSSTSSAGQLGIARGSSAASFHRRTSEHRNLGLGDNQTVTYDPARLRGINVYQVTERDFSTGDRLQFVGVDKQLGIARRDVGTVTQVESNAITLHLDGSEGRTTAFDTTRFRALDHGYAITSHSAQGLTADRVIANTDRVGIVNVGQSPRSDPIPSSLSISLLMAGNVSSKLAP